MLSNNIFVPRYSWQKATPYHLHLYLGLLQNCKNRIDFYF